MTRSADLSINLSLSGCVLVPDLLLLYRDLNDCLQRSVLFASLEGLKQSPKWCYTKDAFIDKTWSKCGSIRFLVTWKFGASVTQVKQ